MSNSLCGICDKRIGYSNDVRCLRCGNPFHLECVRDVIGVDKDADFAAPQEWTCNTCSIEPLPAHGNHSVAAAAIHPPAVPTVNQRHNNIIDGLPPDQTLATGETSAGSQQMNSYYGEDPVGVISANYFSTIMNQFSLLRSDISTMFDKHEQMIANCSSEVRDLRRENSELRHRVEHLQDRLDSIDPQQIVAETKDRVDRERNIMIWGVLEPAKREADRVFVAEVLTFLAQIPPEGIIEVYRVGKKRNASPRVIKVCLASTLHRNAILKAKRTLKNSKYASVYIKPDLTIQQTELLKTTRDQLRAREANGETGLRILHRNGVPTIVPGAPRQQRTTTLERRSQRSFTTVTGSNLPSESDAGDGAGRTLSQPDGADGAASDTPVMQQRTRNSSRRHPRSDESPLLEQLKRQREEEESPKRDQGVKVSNQPTVK